MKPALTHAPSRPDGAAASVAVDVAVLTIRAGTFSVLLVEPSRFRGSWALPGGRVLDTEGLHDAAHRLVQEQARIDLPGAHLEQLQTYGEPGRDPSSRVVSVAYLVFAPQTAEPKGPDGLGARLWPVAEIGTGTGPTFAFDHRRIITDGVERARSKIEYSPLATAFCEQAFTLADLRRVYEAVWGVELDPGNFRRKVMSTTGFVVPLDQTSQPGPGGGRPARLYAPGNAKLLHPAMLRPEREPT